jgi:hypothetical protein
LESKLEFGVFFPYLCVKKHRKSDLKRFKRRFLAPT